MCHTVRGGLKCAVTLAQGALLGGGREMSGMDEGKAWDYVRDGSKQDGIKALLKGLLVILRSVLAMW